MSKQETYLKTEIIERPCKENELTAIVKAEYQSERSKIIDFGSADAESTKSKSPKKIMDIARDEALERVKKEAMRGTTHGNEIVANSDTQIRGTVPQPMTQQMQTQASNTAQNPAPVIPKYKHSTTRPASPKQFHRLKSNAYMDTLEALAENMCGKSFYQISSADADTLIKYLERNPQ